MKDIRWALVGTGTIANEMARTLERNGRHFYAVASRSREKGAAFGEKYRIAKVYTDSDAMLTDPEVDAVYIATPHNTHFGYIMKALESGKHVLAEKAITLNSGELSEAVALAREKGLVLAEAQTIYHMPLYRELRELLASGKLGRVNLVTMNFGSCKEYDMGNRFFNRSLAGGAMLDIGVYALSFVRWFLDSKPERLLSQVKTAPTGVDEQAGMLLTNQEGQMATVMLSLRSKQPKRGVVSCEKGFLEILEYPRATEAKITWADSGKTEVLRAGDCRDALLYEIADMERAIAGEPESMYLNLTEDVMDLMTRFRKSWGVSYPEEE